MSDLSNFEITKRWPAKAPSIIQLYSFPTPNGVKDAVMGLSANRARFACLSA